MGLGETLPRGEVPAPSSLHRRRKNGAISPRLEFESALEQPCSCPQARLFCAYNMEDTTFHLQPPRDALWELRC